jgi:hypothetical protein
MGTTTQDLTIVVASFAILSMSLSAADAKHEQLGPYRAMLTDYRTEDGERIPFCLNVRAKQPVSWWVTNSKGEIVISGQQDAPEPCLE